MWFDYTITIPPNTPMESPTVVECPIAHGVIHRVEVQFPPGCAGLAHVQICRPIHVIYPTNPSGSFAADGRAISFDDYHLILERPYRVWLRGWNFDDTFPHTITVSLGILPESVAANIFGKPRKASFGVLRKLARREPQE